jgi:hypothetical protein
MRTAALGHTLRRLAGCCPRAASRKKGKRNMSEKLSNPLLLKILRDLDQLVKAEEVKTVHVMEREIKGAIKQVEEKFAQTFSLPGRPSKG